MKKSYNINKINEWFDKDLPFPIIIAGPCSAESFEQVYKTAQELSNDSRIKIFRAGIWKARTNPSDFKGIGEIAFEWLKVVKNDFKLKLATEVMSPKHVELTLKHGIDILWLGTRTVSNPYSVQEIADALKGVNIPVLIKNPMNPDLRLWFGAVERMYKAGIKKIGLVHRGFFPFEYTPLRNIPKWELIIDIRLNYPKIPIIVDPSHMAGNTKYIKELTQKAMDLCYDGIMIETHIKPQNALSDANQQLHPKKLIKILNEINYCQQNKSEQYLELYRLREKIDSIDFQLLELLSQRMNVVRQMAKYKKNNNIPILQIQRWREIISTRFIRAEQLGLNKDFIKNLLDAIHLEAIRIQSEENKKGDK